MKARVITLHQIIATLNNLDDTTLISAIEEGFVAYSENRAIVPPVGHLAFTTPPGDVHVKYGYILNDDYYVVKVASGFYDNPKSGLSSSSGIMLLGSKKTGELVAALLDEGYLTNVRTAVAGAIAAKYLAPSHIRAIGIIGTGIQAQMQLRYLRSITDCRDVYVWGRSRSSVTRFVDKAKSEGFAVTPAADIDDLCTKANLIITTTPSTTPLIQADYLLPGTHITAVGADAKGKQELDSAIIPNADIVVADSIDQCVDHGEIGSAVRNEYFPPDYAIELGRLIQDGAGRQNDQQITVADLTGVATQDIQIAKLVYEAIYNTGLK